MSTRSLSKFSSRVLVLVPLVMAASAPTASAQTDEARAAARAAATEGLHAMQEGRYKDALDLCTRAESLMHAPTHLLLIARVQTKLGHLVEAQEAYIKITRERLSPTAPRAFVEAQATAGDELAAITPRVPTLKVDLQGGDPSSTEITIDGAPFQTALVGMASPVNPGAHTLEAKSSSASADPVTVTVAEGAKQNVTLTLKAVATPSPVAQEGTPVESTSDATPTSTSSHAGLRAGGWIGVGIGVVGLVAGTVFVIKNHSDRNDANGLCDSRGCPDSKRAEIASFDSDADTASTLSLVSYGIGAAGLVTGAALLWVSRGKPVSAQSGQLVPWFGKRAMGVRVTF